jgi:Na+-translocating ferredoxin:NAD+ oxidoreductase RNF subunit RnfB
MEMTVLAFFGNHPWGYLTVFLAVMVGGILLLSVITSLVVAWAAGRYSDKIIPKYTEMVEKLLPGKDCGKCSRCTCAEYADAVIHTELDIDLCPYTDEKTQEKMLEIREKLQKLMEDPTPVERKDSGYWDRKF